MFQFLGKLTILKDLKLNNQVALDLKESVNELKNIFLKQVSIASQSFALYEDYIKQLEKEATRLLGLMRKS